MVETKEPLEDPKTMSKEEVAGVVNKDPVTVGGEVEQKVLTSLLSADIKIF